MIINRIIVKTFQFSGTGSNEGIALDWHVDN